MSLNRACLRLMNVLNQCGNFLRLHEQCFSVNFAKALRTSFPFLPEHHQNNASVTVFPISVCTVSISGLHTTIYSEPKKQVVCTL